MIRLLLCVLFAAVSASLSAQEAEPTREERLAEVFAHYLKDGGIWRLENDDHEAGSGSPVAYVKQYQWGPGRAIVLDDTFALLEDGTCQQWTHNVFHWDMQEGAVRGQIFHFAGAWFTGLVHVAGENETAADFGGVLPDGTEFRMRDSTDLSDPRKAVVTAFLPDGESWTESEPVAWVQIVADDRPCGL
jgi:hypothetical protein